MNILYFYDIYEDFSLFSYVTTYGVTLGTFFTTCIIRHYRCQLVRVQFQYRDIVSWLDERR